MDAECSGSGVCGLVVGGLGVVSETFRIESLKTFFCSWFSHRNELKATPNRQPPTVIKNIEEKVL